MCQDNWQDIQFCPQPRMESRALLRQAGRYACAYKFGHVYALVVPDGGDNMISEAVRRASCIVSTVLGSSTVELMNSKVYCVSAVVAHKADVSDAMVARLQRETEP